MRSVLLVDGDEDTLEMYAMGLTCAGYRALIAADAATALSQVRNERPDAVVVGLQLVDGRDGWKLIEDITKDPSLGSTPVVILTERIDSSIAANARRIGCVAVLTKPCLPDELADLILRLLPAVV